MFRIHRLPASGALAAALLSLTFVAASCSSMAPPFTTPTGSLQGFKSRTFVGTPSDLRPSVISALAELGFEVHADHADRTYLTGTRGMSASDPTLGSGRRTWTRVGVSIRQVDMHRRAPRTLVEIDAEPIQGSVDGVIEASIGSIPSSFYEDFFRGVSVRLNEGTHAPVRGFLPPQ